MNFLHIWIIFKKEIKDALRDRKSVLTNIFLPLIMVTVICFIIGIVVNGAMGDIKKNLNIAIISENGNNEQASLFIKDKILQKNDLNVNIKKYNNIEEAKLALTNSEIICIINFKEDFFENIKNDIKGKIEIEYNSTKNTSQIGMYIIKAKINEIDKILAKDKLNELNIKNNILDLVDIGEVDISTEMSNAGKATNQLLMMLLPTYLVTIIVTAGTPVAIDIVAGERERNTFEALLSTRANRLSILIGKFMAVLVFALLAILTSFIGLMLGILLNPGVISLVGQILGIATVITPIYVPIFALILLILSIVTLTIVFAGIQIAISTGAKTLKEAQTYLSYLMFPATIPAFITMFMGAGDMQMYMAFIPVFNTIASFKMVISGIIDYGFLIIGVITNVIFIAIIMYCIIKQFNNEKAVIK